MLKDLWKSVCQHLGRSTVFLTCLTSWVCGDIPQSRFSYGVVMAIFDEIYWHNTEGLKLILERGFNGKKIVIKIAESSEKAVEITSPQSWYLVDTTVTETDWVLPCKFLLTCSPLKSNYSEFAKSGTVEMMYDPVWSLLNEHNFGHLEDVTARFRKSGGIPRYVLEKLDEASQLEMVKAARVVRNVNESLPENQSYKAFHMSVDERTYRSYGLDLASPYVKEIIFSNLPTASVHLS
ncbi:hypothetical protein SELMODRAFT_407686 [Selaginella moellendorffii]|uniref:Uncharacterized protein n=1 Tax=Selaginella moellendorffii TaxID=88036 RepID=D8R6F7_SELML|nr:hypothetical protein SELMODRAFT_407686 [Selaginella moellendorffii]